MAKTPKSDTFIFSCAKTRKSDRTPPIHPRHRIIQGVLTNAHMTPPLPPCLHGLRFEASNHLRAELLPPQGRQDQVGAPKNQKPLLLEPVDEVIRIVQMQYLGGSLRSGNWILKVQRRSACTGQSPFLSPAIVSSLLQALYLGATA